MPSTSARPSSACSSSWRDAPARCCPGVSLLELVGESGYLGDSRPVDMAVKQLRGKLGDDPGDPRFIVRVRGQGDRFDGA
ncbi:MAG: winged helix-turn-helix domain-containing protein [Acidimicrobiales bacterium]|nr:winged helix-turn-helix domain-containing protein [Acidimicrobiales bacterium]